MFARIAVETRGSAEREGDAQREVVVVLHREGAVRALARLFGAQVKKRRLETEDVGHLEEELDETGVVGVAERGEGEVGDPREG